jgi:hypothetical protein
LRGEKAITAAQSVVFAAFYINWGSESKARL